MSQSEYNFCTYFDHNYLTRGLALHRSLRKHCPEFRLWVLCMDETTHEVLTRLDLPEVQLISLQNFEKDDEPLLRAKQNRSKVEYFFTCTPSLPLYILDHWPDVELITYLDADLFFFASPTPLFRELGSRSIAIIGHRFPPHLRYLERTGIYNVGWLSFKRDENAFACLHWWRERCMEWCYDRVEDGRFADQKYLDDWLGRFQNVIVLEHRGANLAPWNLGNYHLRPLNGNTVMVDEQPLIFFHFHGLTKITRWLYHPRWNVYDVNPSMVVRRRIYEPYLQTLFDLNRQLLATLDSDPICADVRGRMKQQGGQIARIKRFARRIRILPSVGSDILKGKFIFLIEGHVI